jgi:subtilisin family serine protease
VAVVDTGVNPWHSHVRGAVDGCRVFLAEDGTVREDGDFRDAVGHGTAVAGVIRSGLPAARLFAVRVFDEGLRTYPSLVARGILRAAAEGCHVVNLSLSVGGGPGTQALAGACAAAREAGCVLVAAGLPGVLGLLPASLPGVFGVVADDSLPLDEVALHRGHPYPYAAPGRPRNLEGLPPAANLWGASFACARVAVHLAYRLGDGGVPGAWDARGGGGRDKGLDPPGACRYKNPSTGD